MARRLRKLKRKSKRVASLLPNAPLSEVVFELRWALQPGPAPAGMLNFDPMLFPVLHRFTQAMDTAGYSHAYDLSHPQSVGPYGVVRRYRKKADLPFPLMQIGPGIFATNESAKYKWPTFKAQILGGVKALLRCYPTDFGCSLVPTYLELRYVDIFDKTTVGSSSLVRFTETGTSLGLRLPNALHKPDTFWGDAGGRVVLNRSLRGRKDTQFSFDLGSASNADTKAELIQMVSKVSSTGLGVPRLTSHGEFIRNLANWLDHAHSVTSPFFREFISPQVMAKFQDAAK
jgi:uncharacterized protein (TIGR04255 family)